MLIVRVMNKTTKISFIVAGAVLLVAIVSVLVVSMSNSANNSSRTNEPSGRAAPDPGDFAKYDKISNGMTKAEVIDMLGTGQECVDGTSSDTEHCTWQLEADRVGVSFEDGRVSRKDIIVTRSE